MRLALAVGLCLLAMEPSNGAQAPADQIMRELEPASMSTRACIRRNMGAAYQSGVYGREQSIKFFKELCGDQFYATVSRLGRPDLADLLFKFLATQEIAPGEIEKAIEDMKKGR